MLPTVGRPCCPRKCLMCMAQLAEFWSFIVILREISSLMDTAGGIMLLAAAILRNRERELCCQKEPLLVVFLHVSVCILLA